jgi:hypothetical protein
MDKPPGVGKEYECKLLTGNWERVTIPKHNHPPRPDMCYVQFGSMCLWVKCCDLREIDKLTP